MYSWEALRGLFFSADLLYRMGRYGNPYEWSNQALKRALDFMPVRLEVKPDSPRNELGERMRAEEQPKARNRLM